jgi:predicted amidophosphoribosyltransferase
MSTNRDALPLHRLPPAAFAALEPLSRALARFVLPSLCLACREAPLERILRGGVCEACWTALPELDHGRCEICDETLPALDAVRCGRCLIEPPPFALLCAAAPYRGTARDVLLAFKFRGADYLAPHLVRLMLERLAVPAGVDALTAVPATRRARRRAPHAAEQLARALSRRIGAPFEPARLAKRRETERQSSLPLERRSDNVRGAFRAQAGAPGHILLVDDVATSGATSRECASALLKAGAEQVTVWCFARASRLDVHLEPSPSRRAGEGA